MTSFQRTHVVESGKECQTVVIAARTPVRTRGCPTICFSEAEPLLSPSPDKGLDRGFIIILFRPHKRGVAEALGTSDAGCYTPGGYLARGDRGTIMSHVEKEKLKLLNRLKRLKGQVEALERAVVEDKECTRVLQQATSCRGALDGFIAEVIEDHIREHLIEPGVPSSDPRAQAAEELVKIVHAYLT